jgi:N-methylhydantoinase A
MSWVLGIDSGGTFCDLVAKHTSSGESRVAKYSSNPDDPIQSILEVIRQMHIPAEEIDLLIHGTTVLTNYLIEEKGPDVVYITNKGFKDVIFVQNGNRQFLYNLQWKKAKPLVKRRNCFELDCRINSKGIIEKDLAEEEVFQLIEKAKERGLKNFAVCFLFSYLNPAHENRIKSLFEARFPEATVSLSHEVYRRWKEYERASSTIADAYLKEYFTRYTSALKTACEDEGVRCPVYIMKSNSGVMDVAVAGEKPNNVIMSGPVAGVLGARFLGELSEQGPVSAITMDIGGTSCDVCLIEKGQFALKSEYEIKWGIPVRVPMTAIRSIGAGGGSIAWIDSGNLLQVGPRSAGGKPGPVCYCRGGQEPTLTDANLILGRINAHYFCNGSIPLDREAAFETLRRLADKIGMNPYAAAESIVRIINNNSANAIRVISIAQGINPAEFKLIAFGGAGGLHASEVASLMRIRKVIVPVNPGHVSALGLLIADLRVDEWSTLIMRSDRVDLNRINQVFAELRDRCIWNIQREGASVKYDLLQKFEMRYYGQNYHREVPIRTDKTLTEQDLNRAFNGFHERHRQHYGFSNEKDLIEIVGVSVTAISKREKIEIPRVSRKDTIAKGSRPVYFDNQLQWTPCEIFERDELASDHWLEGPAVIEEPFSTTLIWPEDRFCRDSFGNIIIEKRNLA